MRSPAFVLGIAVVLCGAACRQQQSNAVQIEENGAISAENVTDDADARAAMLAEQAAALNAQAAAQAPGARRDELRNRANALMAEAIDIQRSGAAEASRIAAAAEQEARNAEQNQ